MGQELYSKNVARLADEEELKKNSEAMPQSNTELSGSLKFVTPEGEFDAVQWEVTIESEEAITDFCGGEGSVILLNSLMDDALTVKFMNTEFHIEAFDWLFRKEENGNKFYKVMKNEHVNSPSVLDELFVVAPKTDTNKIGESIERALASIAEIDAADYDKDLHERIGDAAKGALGELKTIAPNANINISGNKFFDSEGNEIMQKNSSAEHCIVKDNSSHTYIIPFEKLADWNAWCEIDEEDKRSWTAPEYAKIFSGRVVFKDYRID